MAIATKTMTDAQRESIARFTRLDPDYHGLDVHRYPLDPRRLAAA